MVTFPTPLMDPMGWGVGKVLKDIGVGPLAGAAPRSGKP
jgi:hypothetical protein